MNKTLLIFRHEFLITLRRTGFIIMTFVPPLLALLAIGILLLVAGIMIIPAEVSEIGYVDKFGGFDRYTDQGNIHLIRFESPDAATGALLTGDIKEYIVIPEDYISTGGIKRYTLEKQLIPPPATTDAIKRFITGNLLADKVSPATINLIEAPLNVATTRLTATGDVATEQGGYENFIVPGIFSMLLVMAIIFSSTYLLQGLGEEKENRLLEILLSSVSSRQLLFGKIFGIGAAGLVQVAVWIISIPLLLKMASAAFGGFVTTIQLPASFLVLGIIYFVLGYLLFAVFSAATGAVSASSREGQQLVAVFTVPAIVPLWFMSLMMYFPNNPVWVVLSIFPLTAPVEVILRLGLSEVPAWQLVASITVLVLSITGGLLLTSKIFRAYLLLYGKRPNLGEILRNIRSS